jgi:hypothetical protein
MGTREQWLSERYSPGRHEDEVRADLGALRAACDSLSDTCQLALVDATWLPDDELMSARFAGTRSAVVAAHELAGTGFDRLSRVVEIGP